MRFLSIFLVSLLVTAFFVTSFGSKVNASDDFSASAATSANDSGQVVAASGSNRFVAWFDNSPGNYEVFFRRSIDNGATWKPIVNLTRNAGDSITPQMLVQGTFVYVVWVQRNAADTEGNIYFRRSLNDGQTWEPAIKISSTNTIDIFANPQIAASGGFVHISWHDNISSDIFYRRSVNNGATFQAIKNLSDSDTVLSGYDMAMAVSGTNVYVGWDDQVGTGEILVSRSTNNGFSFSSPVPISDNPTEDAFGLDLAATGTYVYAAWSEFNSTSTSRDVYFVRSVNKGSSWSLPRNLGATEGISDFPRIAYSGVFVFITWQDNTAGNYDIIIKRSVNNGASFQAMKNLSVNSGNSQGAQVVAAGANVIITWWDYTPGFIHPDILLKRSTDNGATWKAVVNLSNSAATSWTPLITMVGANVYIIWEEFVSGNSDVLSRRSTDNGATWKPVQNLSNNAGRSALILD
jgi:hypothetical protein